jgi:hypothetical protein
MGATITSLKREVLLGMALAAFVILCAWAWGAPFVATPSASHAQAQGQGQSQTESQPGAQTANFAGTIERTGEQFFLRATGGTIYRLDDARDAQRFVAKAVTVTGRLDAGARLIHVQRITPAAS